jgi:hypothetical protein
VHLVAQNRKRRKIDEERLRLAQETHRLLHYVYGDAARELGHLAVPAAGAGSGPPPSGAQEQARPDGGAR